MSATAEAPPQEKAEPTESEAPKAYSAWKKAKGGPIRSADDFDDEGRELLVAAHAAKPTMLDTMSQVEAQVLADTTGKGNSKASPAKAKSNGDKPKREVKPKGWRQGTFAPLYEDPTGSIVLASEDGENYRLIGRFPDEDFYSKARAKLKREGFDPDTVTIVTLRARNARRSEPPTSGSGD
jgi:hypothetical protein